MLEHVPFMFPIVHPLLRTFLGSTPTRLRLVHLLRAAFGLARAARSALTLARSCHVTRSTGLEISSTKVNEKLKVINV